MFTTYHVPPRSPQGKKDGARPLTGWLGHVRGRLQRALDRLSAKKGNGKKANPSTAGGQCRSRLARAV